MRFKPVRCNMMQLTRKHLNTIQASYTLEGAVLENVDNIKYLGATITNDLKWNTHISNICTKAYRSLGFLRRTLFSCPQNVENVDNIKYLGATITNALKWNTHISNICTKAYRSLGFLRRTLFSCPKM